jgi:hypothetical protein
MLLHVLLIATAVHTVEANPRLHPPLDADMTIPKQVCATTIDPIDRQTCEWNVYSYQHRAEEWTKFGRRPPSTMPLK